ncbi:MAG: hypothetical protein IT371_03285 [Deltaproteobacteria bacterium]|nr:hypothetical protein [Deltaproteobacteria bacterium]
MVRFGIAMLTGVALLAVVGLGSAEATGRLSDNAQRTAKAAALKGAAFYLNHGKYGNVLRAYFGREIHASQLVSVKVLSTSATGVQRWLIKTQRQIPGQNVAVAKVQVSVKQLANGKWAAYTGGTGSKNVTIGLPFGGVGQGLQGS